VGTFGFTLSNPDSHPQGPARSVLVFDNLFLTVAWGRDGWAQFAIFSMLAIAALSWHVMERPILRLKKRFPYRAEPAMSS